VLIERTSSGDSFLVLLRFNRRLPTNRIDGGADANFVVDGSGVDATPETIRSTRPWCYRGFVGNDNGSSDYVAGRVVPLQVTVVGSSGRYAARRRSWSRVPVPIAP